MFNLQDVVLGYNAIANLTLHSGKPGDTVTVDTVLYVPTYVDGL